MPETTGEDGQEATSWVGEAVGSPRRVVRIIKKVGIDMGRIHFHKGWFHDTFPDARINRIALLHIDCDFYAPVRLCLETWFDKLSPGAFVQIDDYASFQGCRKAIDEFLNAHPDLYLHKAGVGGGRAFYFRKPD